MKFNLSIDIAVVVSLLTVFFYSCGQSYLAAYMGVFYIDPVVLNFPTAEKINWGFLNCANGLTFILLGGLLLSFVFYIFMLLNIRYPSNLKNPFKSKKQQRPQIHNQNLTDEQRANRIRLFFWPFFVFFLALSSFFIFAAIDIKTTKSARKALANPTQLPRVNVNGQEFYLIKCGSSLCAAIDEKKNVSLVEPKNVVLLGSNFKEK
jgi:magnesium-transporting ATPase (P-type)